MLFAPLPPDELRRKRAPPCAGSAYPWSHVPAAVRRRPPAPSALLQGAPPAPVGADAPPAERGEVMSTPAPARAPVVWISNRQPRIPTKSQSSRLDSPIRVFLLLQSVIKLAVEGGGQAAGGHAIGRCSRVAKRLSRRQDVASGNDVLRRSTSVEAELTRVLAKSLDDGTTQSATDCQAVL